MDFSEYKVFADPVVRNIIIILRKEENKKNREEHVIKVLAPSASTSSSIKDLQLEVQRTIPQALFAQMPSKMFRIQLDTKIQDIKSKLTQRSFNLGIVAVVSWGARGVPVKNFHLAKSINHHCKPMIKGENIHRYNLNWAGKWLLYDVDLLYRPAFPELFENDKIVISKVTGEKGIICTLDEKRYYTDDSLCCCILKHLIKDKPPSFLNKRKITISPSDIKLSTQYNLKYILGLLNSRLTGFYFKKLLGNELNVYPESVEQLPICRINFNDNKEKKRHDEIVSLVDKMLALNKRLASIQHIYSYEGDELIAEIEKTDRQIDSLVYELYGLTEDERKMVEET